MVIKKEIKSPVHVKKEPPMRVKQEFVPVPVKREATLMPKKEPSMPVAAPMKKEPLMSTRPIFRSDLNADPPTMRVTLPNGVTEVVALERGELGFCKAVFQCMEGETETEVPNLVLVARETQAQMKSAKKGKLAGKKEVKLGKKKVGKKPEVVANKDDEGDGEAACSRLQRRPRR